jgi:hypothetical protein
MENNKKIIIYLTTGLIINIYTGTKQVEINYSTFLHLKKSNNFLLIRTRKNLIQSYDEYMKNGFIKPIEPIKINKYNNASIYQIICNKTGLIYVGSTIKTIYERLSEHERDYKRYLKGKCHYITSFKVIENNNYKVELLKSINCNDSKELKIKERYYIETIKCVNKVIPTRTNKEYRENNKDVIKTKAKQYYNNNKDKFKNKFKETQNINFMINHYKQLKQHIITINTRYLQFIKSQ